MSCPARSDDPQPVVTDTIIRTPIRSYRIESDASNPIDTTEVRIPQQPSPLTGLYKAYYYGSIVQYAQVSVKFPAELNDEIERFIEETGLYTNRSEFVKDASRRLLQEYNDDVEIAALRLENALERAERDRRSDEAVREEVADIRATTGTRLNPTDAEEAVEESRRDTSDRFYGRTSDVLDSDHEEAIDVDDDNDDSGDAR